MTLLRSRSVAVATLVLVTASVSSCSGARGTSVAATSTPPVQASAAPTSTTIAENTSLGANTSTSTATAAAAAHSDLTLRTPDGRTRSYHLFVPAGIVGSAAKVPLLVALHGGLGSGTQFERTSGFDTIAVAQRFVVVYPDGTGTGADGATNRTWDGGACCGAAARQSIDDVAFIEQLVATLRADYPIDPLRVFAAGHSNGGILAYRLACEAADVFAAVGVQSTSLEVQGCAPSRPVSLLHIHGTADQNIPIDGGVGQNGVAGIAFNPPIAGVHTIAAADGCPSSPTESADASNADLTIDRWEPCASGSVVEFIRVAGAPHAWMGHPAVAAQRSGTPYSKLDASMTIWTFLAAHGRG